MIYVCRYSEYHPEQEGDDEIRVAIVEADDVEAAIMHLEERSDRNGYLMEAPATAADISMYEARREGKDYYLESPKETKAAMTAYLLDTKQ